MTGKASWAAGAVLYQVYVRSFRDGDGDGVGDLRGVREQLPYLEWLGVDGLWLTPFYRSPQVDHGYDVADYYDVDPLFGSLDEIDGLIADAHERGLRVLVDLVPNHTSDRHEWFTEAVADPTSPARRRYLFRDGKGPDGDEPPNNWRSVFGGPAWTRDPAGTGQWYLHLFAPEQPDLDWRNPEVVDAFDDVLRFWLDRGVDGFRIDVAHGLFKDEQLRDNPVRDRPRQGNSDVAFSEMEQTHSFDQPEVHTVYRRWRTLVDAYDHDPLLVGEVFLWDPARVATYVCDDELHTAFGFLLAGQRWAADDLRRAVTMTIEGGTGPARTAWILSNHDLPRQATRFGGGVAGVRRARAAALLLLGLPGTPFLYMGEELGLEDGFVPPEDRQDPLWFRSGGTHPGRDGCRIPIPWDTTAAAGFTAGTPWLPMPPGWEANAVASQRDDSTSTLSLYRSAIHARRRSEPLRGSAFAWRDSPDGTLAFDRTAGGSCVTVVVNTTSRPMTVALGSGAPDEPRRLLVASADGATVEGDAVTVPGDSAVWVG